MDWKKNLRRLVLDQGKTVEQREIPRERSFHPFALSEASYQYYDMGRIAANLEFKEEEFRKAGKMVREGLVVLDQVEFQRHLRGQREALCGVARGHYAGKRGEAALFIMFDRYRIMRAGCSVPGCSGYFDGIYTHVNRSICVHLQALLILLDQYLKKYNPGDSTDTSAELLFRGFRDQHTKTILGRQAERQEDLMLVPVLERQKDAVYATFKAGTDKLYVVKNLNELVQTYEARGVIRFGTKTEVNLANHRISESSREMFQFVCRIVREEQYREARSRNVYRSEVLGEEIKNKFELYGDRLDQFYTLLEGKTVDCNDKSGAATVKTRLIFREGLPQLGFFIEKDVDDEDLFHGIRVTGQMPEFYRGSKSSYYFDGDAFCRIPEKDVGALLPLIEMKAGGDSSFYVGRKHLAEFYQQVLPALSPYVQVVEAEPETIQTYVPPQAEFAFYLDAEDGRLTCRPRASYGEENVSLLDAFREGFAYQAYRNVPLEEEILYYVRQYFPEYDPERGELYCDETEDTLLRLLDGGIEYLMTLGTVHSTDRFRNRNIRRKPMIKLGISVDSDLMNLTLSGDDLTPAELVQVLQNYRKKKRYYRLKNGDLVEVNEKDVEVLHQMMEAMHLSPRELAKGNMKIPAYRALYLNKMLEQTEDIYLNRDKHFKNLIKEFKTLDDSEFEVPESLQNVMRSYQVKGFQWMKTLEHYGFGGILADDMGLGKTLQMISVLLAAREKGTLGTALIVCPASLVYNWGMEFARFAPELRVTLVVGSQAERAGIIRNYRDSDVLVTSYDLLKRDVAEYEGKEFGYQVLDEAQYIKNHSTAAAKSVKVIRSRQRYALTGTPIENRLSELWSIFDYLMPGFLYSYETFRKELEGPIVKQNQEEASARLKKMVSPFILRRLKQDVLKDLPDKIEEIRYAGMEGEQQRIYDGQVVRMTHMLEDQDAEDFRRSQIQILAELTRIRQICCDPSLLFENYGGGSAKREACMELIRSAIEGEHKILVFSQFTSMLELLEQDLEKEGIPCYQITGATPKEQRVEMVNSFNQNTVPVFLISLKAGGTGLNLTGADVVIHYDPWWNQAAQNQATDRAHRIGQTKVVSVYKLIAKGTIEEKIVKLQEAKQGLADAVLSGETGGISQLSKEELLELLQG